AAGDLRRDPRHLEDAAQGHPLQRLGREVRQVLGEVADVVHAEPLVVVAEAGVGGHAGLLGDLVAAAGAEIELVDLEADVGRLILVGVPDARARVVEAVAEVAADEELVAVVVEDVGAGPGDRRPRRDAVARARIGAAGDALLADAGGGEPGGRADGELLPAVLPLPGRGRGVDVGGADPAAVAVAALDHDP